MYWLMAVSSSTRSWLSTVRIFLLPFMPTSVATGLAGTSSAHIRRKEAAAPAGRNVARTVRRLNLRASLSPIPYPLSPRGLCNGALAAAGRHEEGPVHSHGRRDAEVVEDPGPVVHR